MNDEFDRSLVAFLSSYRGPISGSYGAALQAVRAGDRCPKCGVLPATASGQRRSWSWRCQSCIDSARERVNDSTDCAQPSKRNPRFEGRRARAREGHHLSGPPPFGYWRAPGSSRLVIQQDEALLVRRIFRDYRRLKSLKKLAAILNSEGLRTRRGSLWSRAGLRHILGNKVYRGQSRFEEIEREKAHPPIVASISFNLAAKILKMNDKRGGHDED